MKTSIYLENADIKAAVKELGKTNDIGVMFDKVDNQFVKAFFHLVSRHHYAEIVDTGRHMFNADVVFLENRQAFAQKANFVGHMVFINRDCHEILFARYTRDCLAVILALVADYGTRTFRLVGVENFYRDIEFLHGEYAVRMKYVCAHISKLA